jgi:CBS domain-containing protein
VPRDLDLKESRARDWMLVSFPIITPATRVSTALRLLLEHEIPALPVCEGGQLRGLANEKALLRCTPSELTTPNFRELPDLLDKVTVSECIPKSPGITISPETPVEEVAALMARHAVDTIPVTQEGRPVGLVTWTFALGAALFRSRQRTPVAPCQTPRRPVTTEAWVHVDLSMSYVRDWMMVSFPTISQRTTVATAIHLLQAHHVPVLPVCEKQKFLGFVDEKVLLRLTPSVATTHSITEIRYLLDQVPIGGMFCSPRFIREPGYAAQRGCSAHGDGVGRRRPGAGGASPRGPAPVGPCVGRCRG